MEICFCAGQLGFLSLYGTFKFRPSHLINFGASQMIVTHFLRWFQIPFSEVFWTTFDFHFHFDWNATSKTILHDCHSSSIIHLMLHMYRYIDSLRIKYHLLSVVILVKMFANVFSYNPITSWKEFSKTSIYTATADEFDSSVRLTRPNVTFAAIRSEIVYSFLFVVVIAYILVFFRPLSVNSAKAFLIISTIYEITVLAFLVLGKRKFKSQFRETFIEEKPYI